MQKQTIYIFFSEENLVEAKQLFNDFSKANINCIFDMPAAQKVEEVVNNNQAKVLLLVSDNYLKNIDEIRHLEELLHEQRLANLTAVIVDGRRIKNNDSKELEVYPTNIETLNNGMYYRDYWYEAWVLLRKECKNELNENQGDLENNREIANKMYVGGISTYIRKINSANPTRWDAFCANNYQEFLKKMELEFPLEEENLEEENSNQNTPVQANLYSPTIKEDSEIVIEKKIELLQEETILTEELDQTTNEENKEEEKDIAKHLLNEEATLEIDSEINNEIEDVIEDHRIDISNLSDSIAEQDDLVSEEKLEEKEEIVFVLDKLDELENVDSQSILAKLNIAEVSDIDVLFHFAESQTEEGNYADARTAYKHILEIDPYNGRALIWLARILAKNFPDDALEAASIYRKAIMANNETANLYYEYALLQKDRFQSYNKAIDSFREALEIDPMFEDAYLGLAQCQVEVGMKDQAKANYLQACALDATRFQTVENDAQFSVIRLAIPEVEEVEEEELVVEIPVNPNANTVVLVTGATSGIGLAIAELFIVNGYKVIITGRRNERLLALKENMEGLIEGTQIYCLPFDVTDLTAVKEAIKGLPEGWNEIDILINNAGLAKGLAPVQEGNIEHWEAMIDTNLKGLLYVSRAVSPIMVERQKGHIINIGSVAATQVYTGGGVYCATKAAVNSLTQSMRLDLFKSNVKVSIVSPGHVDETEFATVRYDGTNKANIYEDFKPLSAEDIANTVYYIANQPEHVNIQDVLMFSTQQASVNDVNRTGRKD